MNTLMQASQQWATRPDDQRFCSMEELREYVAQRKVDSWTTAQPGRNLQIIPQENDILIEVPTVDGPQITSPTNWGFSQLCTYAQVPARYLRTLATHPDGPQLASINLQYGLDKMAMRDDALILGHSNGTNELRALTSVNYGRIWDLQVVQSIERVNQDGRWTIPSASYDRTDPKRATTLYASDRDVFIFLVDVTKRIPFEDREMYRGFFAWNSEVGSQTFGLMTFLYDFVCDNRIVWGAVNVKELRIRHTGGAPERFAYEGARQLANYSNASFDQDIEVLNRASQKRLGEKDEDIQSWLNRRGFSNGQASDIIETAKVEEGEARSLWQIVNGVTAYARKIQHTDQRVELERKAGNLLQTA